MAGSWFFDENFNGVSEEFFDKVIDSLDFPLEDVDVNAGAEDWNAKFQCLEPPSMDILTSLPSETSKPHRNFYSLYNRTSKLKQSADTTTSSSSAPLSNESSDVKYKFSFKTSSPVSILESSSSHSVENSRGFETKPQIAVKRARSKRTRPPCFNKQFTLPFVSPASSASEKTYSLAVSESESDSLTEKRSKPVKRKQKKKNLFHLSGVEMRKPSTEESGETKRCMHCEVTSTPQWREGPMGPKTLCNACGVRYRSGRLFPEYRPAASPTFIPLVHSNSHKKVIEMRNQVTPRANVSTLSSPQLGNSVR